MLPLCLLELSRILHDTLQKYINKRSTWCLIRCSVTFSTPDKFTNGRVDIISRVRFPMVYLNSNKYINKRSTWCLIRCSVTFSTPDKFTNGRVDIISRVRFPMVYLNSNKISYVCQRINKNIVKLRGTCVGHVLSGEITLQMHCPYLSARRFQFNLHVSLN